ncbi:MAG: hypothetical protein RJA49_476 [Actinomycetota bacterium]|jgi:uncharacterized RDD family membrane protein YckC
MDDRSPADSPVPCRVPIHHLTPHQVDLLRAVLRAGEVPFGIVRGEVVAGAAFTDEIEQAVEWAAVDTTLAGEEFDDPEYRSDRAPLVRPPRPPLRDGRHQATRWRRLVGGLLDEFLVGLPTLLATSAGAPYWTAVVIHAIYYTVPTTMFGWSIGKLWLGVRVVEVRTQRVPRPTTAVIRWVVAAVPMLLGMFVGLEGDWMSAAVMAVYAPIMVDLRGLHDYAAGTVVVERSARLATG